MEMVFFNVNGAIEERMNRSTFVTIDDHHGRNITNDSYITVKPIAVRWTVATFTFVVNGQTVLCSVAQIQLLYQWI
jgi:hypothetical protein